MKYPKIFSHLLLAFVLATSQAFAYTPANPNGSAVSANSAPVVPASDWTANLPTGAATSANQTTANTSLSSIVTNTANIPTVAQKLGSGSLPVVLAAPNYVVSSSFTRPGNATATVVGNMFSNSATPGSVTPQSYAMAPANGVPVYVTGGLIMIQTSGGAGVTVTGGSFRLHIFGQSPTVGASGGDALAFQPNVAMANWCGSLLGTLLIQGTDWSVGLMAPETGSPITCKPAGGSSTIYGLLESRNIFTPPNAGIVQTALTAQ